MNTRLCGWVLLLVLALATLGAAGCSQADSASDDPEADQEAAGAAEASGEEGEEGEGGDEEEGEGDDEDEEQPVPVEVIALERGPIESVLRASSTLEAERSVKVFAEAARRIEELLVEEGHRVRRGQVLVRLQDDEQRNKLASVKNELAQAEREYGRQQRLHAEKLISEEEWNQATFDLDQLRIKLADAERELSYTEVKAPISGTITQRLVNLGEQVSIGQHLFDIVDFDSLVARVYLPEKHLGQLRDGLPARITAQALGDARYDGDVLRISPIVDARTGTVKVTVDVGRKSGLRPGMYVDVALVTATHPDALLVPKRALVYDSEQMFVFRLLEERRVERVFLEPALTDKFNIEPAAGLGDGDLVVVAGQAGLKEGALVSLPEDEQEEESEGEGEEDAADTDAEAAVERASL